MKTFVDNAGRTWTVAVNVDAVKRMKTLLGVNLMEAVEGTLLEKLQADPVLLCDVLYCVCKLEADAKSVSDEDFGRSMAGDAIDAATTAFLEELVDFFPSLRRGLLRKATAKLRTFQAKALAAAEARLDSPELQKTLDDALLDITGSASSLPESSASPPAPSPSAN